MTKRKAESKYPLGLILPIRNNPKKSKIPTSKALGGLLDNCVFPAAQEGEIVAATSFSSAVKKLDFSEQKLPLGTAPQGKNFISLPISLDNVRREGDCLIVDIYELYLKQSDSFQNVRIAPVELDSLDSEDLNLQTSQAFPSALANLIFFRLERELTYFDGKISKQKVSVLGVSFKIPRKHVAFGEECLSFTFDGHTVPVRKWTPLMKQLTDVVSRLVDVPYNFVLVYRFKNGGQYLEESKDFDETNRDTDMDYPMTTVLFGRSRNIVFRRFDMSKKKSTKCTIEHGSILITNGLGVTSWNHSFPPVKGSDKTSLVLQFIRKLPIILD